MNKHIERIRAANNECELVRAVLRGFPPSMARDDALRAMTAVLSFIDAQAAEIERLRADAARYQWLRRKCVQLDLTHATVATLVKDQSELDAAMKETP